VVQSLNGYACLYDFERNGYIVSGFKVQGLKK